MITENLSTLKIHKLTQEQYDRELEAGRIEGNAIYLTPDKEIDLTPYATIEQVMEKADISHVHDDRYYTETEIDAKLETKVDIDHNHNSLYDAIGSAQSALASAKNYTDEQVAELSTVTSAVTSTVASNTQAIDDIKNGVTIDSFADVESALNGKQSVGDYATKDEVQTVSDALTEYKDAHTSDYTNAQVDAKIKAVADDVAALNDTYASDEELAQAIENEVTRANGAYATKSLETTVSNHTADTVAHTTAAEKEVWNAALQASDVATGSANGTISVEGSDVAVKGLGSAAYTASTAYATAAQGTKADNALQSVEVGTGLKVSAKANNKQTIEIDDSVVFVFDCGSASKYID